MTSNISSIILACSAGGNERRRVDKFWFNFCFKIFLRLHGSYLLIRNESAQSFKNLCKKRPTDRMHGTKAAPVFID